MKESVCRVLGERNIRIKQLSGPSGRSESIMSAKLLILVRTLDNTLNLDLVPLPFCSSMMLQLHGPWMGKTKVRRWKEEATELSTCRSEYRVV